MTIFLRKEKIYSPEIVLTRIYLVINFIRDCEIFIRLFVGDRETNAKLLKTLIETNFFQFWLSLAIKKSV